MRFFRHRRPGFTIDWQNFIQPWKPRDNGACALDPRGINVRGGCKIVWNVRRGTRAWSGVGWTRKAHIVEIGRVRSRSVLFVPRT